MKTNTLHRFVEPFDQQNTALWRDRERIRNALTRIRDGADKASRCLEKTERSEHDIQQASIALHEMEIAIIKLNSRPKIVCLCGSTRFFKTFQEQSLALTKQGIIVLSIGCATASDDDHGITAEEKSVFNELHKRKIDICDEVLVLNVGGYIGQSTRSEIDHALKIGKPVNYLS